jgi:hypothetical protein
MHSLAPQGLEARLLASRLRRTVLSLRQRMPMLGKAPVVNPNLKGWSKTND